MLGKGEKRNEGMHPKVGRNIVGEVDTSDVYLPIGFDAITENDTPQLPADILSATGHGKRELVLTLPWPEEYSNLEDVDVFKSAAALLGTNTQDRGITSAQKFSDMLKEGISGKKLVVKIEHLGKLRGALSLGKGVLELDNYA
ncbi:hypothetical protein BHYA_0119g00210 [Botrytis hyacinthi]|uniref:Uncharacterized protein n=1 Tax=Botrytis hyacinthi TaxID=278943 RepID=A0A4Z1GPV8_9HELO|nr:hypothetical protein BHYA_0119g00210 [Botrytis hyacinthi]